MLKKFGLAVLMLILVPTFSFAGIISAAVLTGSGSGTISSSGSKNYTVTTNPMFVITPVGGFNLDKVTLRIGSGLTNQVTPNVGTGLPGSSAVGTWNYTVPLNGSVQTLSVYFKQASAAVRLSANLGISPKTAVAGTPLQLSGLASTIFPAGAGASYTLTTASPNTLSVTSGTVTNTSAILSKFTAAQPGSYTVTLTLTSGLVTSNSTCTINVIGQGLSASNYCLSCHTDSPQAIAYAASIHANYAISPCQGCHNPGLALAHPGNPPTGAGVMPACISCHNGNATDIVKGPHFSAANASKALFGQFTATGIGPSYVTANDSCTTCHNAHTPAPLLLYQQYAANVHADTLPSTTNITARGAAQIDANGKLVKPGYDFKFYGAAPGVTYSSNLSPLENSRSQECVRCHTTTGFVNFVTSGYQAVQAWGVDGDKTKEVITCAACHTDTEGTVRIPATAWAPYLGYSTPANQRSGSAEIPAKFVLEGQYAVTVSSLGVSDICVSCHSHGGKSKVQISGNLVKKLNTFNSYSVVRANVAWGSHGTAIAAAPHLTENNFAYKFAGQSYNLGDHGKIGVGNYGETGNAGPCVGCHLATDRTTAQGGHTFDAWKNFGPTNQYQTTCWHCHIFNEITATRLSTSQAGAFAAQTSVKRVLRTTLGLAATKSLTPSASNPIRFYTGLGNFGYANRANLQGANMNSLMPNNSWWLHGALINKQILFDSLDVALHGTITGSVADLSTGSFGLTPDQITKALAWFRVSSFDPLNGTKRPVPLN